MKLSTKRLLTQLFVTKIGRLAVCFSLIITFAFLYKFYEWALYPMIAFMAYPVSLGVVMLFYGLIINPLKKLFNR